MNGLLNIWINDDQHWGLSWLILNLFDTQPRFFLQTKHSLVLTSSSLYNLFFGIEFYITVNFILY